MNKSILLILLIALAGIIVYSLSDNKSGKQADNNAQAAVQEIDPETFKQKIEEDPGMVIDVRTAEEYEEGHLAMTDRHYDLLSGDLEANLDSLDKDETYYLYCRSGNRSGKAAELMKEEGFSKIYNIGGYTDLVNSGLEGSN